MDLSERPIDPQTRRHPWEVARFEHFAAVMSRALGSTSTPVRVLDAGAGDAWLASHLAALLPHGSEVWCWDIEYTPEEVRALSVGAPSGLHFTSETPADQRFDWLLMLDVLEHIEDDHRALRELVAHHLEPGARVLISVPAHQALFSAHDSALRHFRRYSSRQLRQLVERCGLERLDGGGLFYSLLLPRALQTLRERLSGFAGKRGVAAPPSNLGDWQHGALVTGLVETALRLDNRFADRLKRWGLGVAGLSVWTLCRKP